MENVPTAKKKTTPQTAKRLLSNNSHVVVLIGNPNVGKSVIFHILTGKYVTVSNYPGTTIEITRGLGKIGSDEITFIDTPGINGFVPNSEDEQVTRDILLNEKVTTVLQVGDAKNLRRVLTLSLQLSEMNIPFVLNLNMMDELQESGLTIDTELIKKKIGVPVITTVAVRRVGTHQIRKSLPNAKKSTWKISYPPLVEKAISEISVLIESPPVAKRAMALLLLMEDESLQTWVHQNMSPSAIENMRAIISTVEKKLGMPISYVVAQTRFRHVDKLSDMAIKKDRSMPSRLPAYIDGIVSHPLWGLPILLGSLAVLYLTVGVFGAQIMVDFIETILFGQFINPAAVWLFKTLVPVTLIQDLFVGNYGIITMALTYGFAIVLPIVTTFFFVFSLFEDSGYLSRIALMLNRTFRLIGLNGKAVLPMILGLGCDTMASLSTRILETKKERRIAIFLLALGVPCSAQLGVILGMTALLPWYATLLWIMVVILVMITVGSLSSRILPGDISDFILELPPLRLPLFANIVVKTISRVEWYVKELIPVFILGTLILFFLDKMNILPFIINVASPIVHDFLGLPAETAEAFLIGFLRRDYGAAGLFNLARGGELTGNQVLISIVTITLFMPCIANLLVIIKELGLRIAFIISIIILPIAFLIGGLLNLILNLTGIVF
jgi:ferrous iron transport protein B